MSFQVRGGQDLARITRQLKAMDDKKVVKKFRTELRAAARPVVPAVRASIRRIPSTRPYTAQGLRGKLSKATKLEIKTSGRQAAAIIRVDGRAMPAKAKSVAAYMEGSKPRWRHPVFGSPAVWVPQPAKPYFYTTMRIAGPLARSAVGRVIDQISKEIT